MRTRQDLEKAIVETQHKYNDIICVNDSRICEGCLNELPKQQVINEKVHNQKSSWRIQKVAWDSLRKNEW